MPINRSRGVAVVEGLEPRRLLAAATSLAPPDLDVTAGRSSVVAIVGRTTVTAHPGIAVSGEGLAMEAVARHRFRGPIARLEVPAVPASQDMRRWSWQVRLNWGDGSRSTGGRVVRTSDATSTAFEVVARHLYRNPGTYPVTLRVLCRVHDPAARVRQPQQSLSLTATATVVDAATAGILMPITSMRTGGLAGDTRTITVTPGGWLTASGRFAPSGARQLTADDRARLRRAFDGWGALQSRYESQHMISDGFTFGLAYGDKQVQSETGADPPELFRAAVELLEALAAAAQ